MKYFIDTEFLEGKQKKTFFGIPYGETKPTIDLISIGIVAEDGREYYAISKDFNLKEAWNRFQWKEWNSTHNENLQQKQYWIRENVLKPIFRRWYAIQDNIDPTVFDHKFTYKEFKRLLNMYGKTNKQIVEEIKEFTVGSRNNIGLESYSVKSIVDDKLEFYGYNSDYDWVVFCWLFGKMIDLPNGFPKYCVDLKQELDSKINLMVKYKVTNPLKLKVIDFLSGKDITFKEAENINWNKWVKEHKDYPKQTNKHNALADARWNKELYKFLKDI